jgi:threonine synthase
VKTVSRRWKLPTITIRFAPTISRDLFASRAPNMWRYRELLPLPAGYQPSLPVGFTPLVSAPRLGERSARGAAGQK